MLKTITKSAIMIKKRVLLSSLFVGFLLFTGCSNKAFVDIADVKDYSQNPVDYIQGEDPKIPGVKLTSKTIHAAFDARYFTPWTLKRPPYDVQKVKWPWQSYTPDITFKENMRPIDSSWYKLMLLEANFDSYGKISKPGIIIHTDHIRNFPTYKPVFKNPKKAGEGYPFDYNMNSVGTANEPVMISHYSKTKEWVYVITSYTSGWLPASSVALISKDIISKWSQARQAVLLEDDLPLYDLEKNFVTNSRIGMMLPIMKVEDGAYQGILATAQTEGVVTFSIVRIPKASSNSEPMDINSQGVAIMSKAFMNKPYGWGGIYLDRDCSSTMMDMFKPFYMWLPRNSKEQSKIGRVIDLSQLKTKQKEQEIIANGLPFQTLLYKKGHIMLYIGAKDGHAMILHNMWAITTKSKNIETKNVVGRTVITTLKPGDELKGYDKKHSLLNEITSMNILTMEPTENPIVIKPKKKTRKKSRRELRKEKEAAEKAQKEKEAAAKAKAKNKETTSDKKGEKEPAVPKDGEKRPKPAVNA